MDTHPDLDPLEALDRQQAHGPQGAGTYQAVADKIGLVPNVRGKDNFYQAVAVGMFALIGATVGFLVKNNWEGLALGAVGGLVVGGLLSGGVLLVIGLFRRV